MAATLLFGRDQISVTDVECQWASSKPRDIPAQVVEATLNVKPHRSTDRDLTAAEIQQFHDKLLNMGTPVGFTWSLQEEAQESSKLLPDIEDILFSEEHLISADKENLLKEKMLLSGDTIEQVCRETIGQAKNAEKTDLLQVILEQ